MVSQETTSEEHKMLRILLSFLLFHPHPKHILIRSCFVFPFKIVVSSPAARSLSAGVDFDIDTLLDELLDIIGHVLIKEGIKLPVMEESFKKKIWFVTWKGLAKVKTYRRNGFNYF